jgi:hypothetical protein
VTQFTYNSKKIEFYDESQARDSSGKWTDGGASKDPYPNDSGDFVGGNYSEEYEYTEREKTPEEGYHITEKDVIKEIAKNGLIRSQPKIGVSPKVYFKDNIPSKKEISEEDASDMAILKVKIPKSYKTWDDTEVREYTNDKGNPRKPSKNSAFFTRKSISPENISIMKSYGVFEPIKNFVKTIGFTSSVEFYDPSQARDNAGRWSGSGGDGKESLSGTTTVYHGTTADVLGKIREAGLKPSRDGVHGKGVYATDNQRLALEYGCLKAPQATKIGGKVLLGIVEVAASGFKSVYEEKRDKDPYKVFLSEKEVLPSAIKRMMIFDAKPVRKWIFEGGEKPKPIAVKNLEEGTIFVPILIDESELTNLEEGECPVETQDIKANLENRQEAIDIAHYGPANPKEPNEDYWKAKAEIFDGSVKEAKTMLCGNCAGFNQTKNVLGCIRKGIGADAKEVEQAGDLGFCEIFDFKCASLRTCDAWIVGGPITDEKELARTIAQTPAPKKDRIKGSEKNPEGTASTRSEAGDIEVSQQVEEALKAKIAEFKKKHPSRNAPTLGALKKVFRRGAGAYSVSHRPKISGGAPNSRNAWAIARVNKFLKMAGGGKVKKSYREADGDLLRFEESSESTNFYDPSQERDESGRWSGSGASAQGKFIERIKRDNPKADVASEAVKKGVNTIIKGVRGAKIAVQYGATKTVEIKKWLGSSEGKEFLNTAGDTLRVIGAGAIGAIRGINNDRYKILVGGLINPALVPYLAGASATRGMFDQVAKEYRGKGVGRAISNKIREKIGVKPMQAFVETIKLQSKQPPIDDVVSYLADVLRVSIEEAIEGKERFEVISFYDPSQNRDSSGKWTSGGGSAVATEPEQGMPIYDEDENKPISPIGDSDEELTQAEKIEKELNPDEQEYAQEFMQVLGPPTGMKNIESNSKEYKEDVVNWSKSFSEQGIDKEDAVQMAVSLHKYAGNDHVEVNEALRQMDSGYKGKDSSSAPNLEALGIAEAMEMAMDIAPKIKESVIWRGLKSGTEQPIGQDRTHKLAKSIKVGQVIEDFGFSSFSLKESIGKQFSNWDVDRVGVQSKVLIKVKNADGVGVKMPSFASSFINEKEVLLRPETKLKITSVKREKQKVNALFRGETDFVYHTEVEAEIVK